MAGCQSGIRLCDSPSQAMCSALHAHKCTRPEQLACCPPSSGCQNHQLPSQQHTQPSHRPCSWVSPRHPDTHVQKLLVHKGLKQLLIIGAACISEAGRALQGTHVARHLGVPAPADRWEARAIKAQYGKMGRFWNGASHTQKASQEARGHVDQEEGGPGRPAAGREPKQMATHETHHFASLGS